MPDILLEKIIELISNSFTSIKTKLTTLYNNIEPPTPPTPPTPGVSLDLMVNEGVLCSNGSYQNVTIENFKQYTYLYLVFYESNKNYKYYAPYSYVACYKSNEIGTGIWSALWIGYFRDSTTQRYAFNISGNNLTITPTEIPNRVNAWVNVYGSNDQIFDALIGE